MRIPGFHRAPRGAAADDDGALLDRVRRGDRDAAEALARRYLGAAYAVALAVTRNPADAEDAAQDALVTALARADECRDPGRFAGWLMTIVRNRSRNLRDAFAARRSDPLPEEGAGDARSPDPADRARDREQGERLLAALETLGEAQREVVLLHDLQGWRHAEIAAALGTSEGMSRQHLFAAHRALRQRLAGDAPGGGSDGR